MFAPRMKTGWIEPGPLVTLRLPFDPVSKPYGKVPGEIARSRIPPAHFSRNGPGSHGQAMLLLRRPGQARRKAKEGYGAAEGDGAGGGGGGGVGVWSGGCGGTLKLGPG